MIGKGKVHVMGPVISYFVWNTGMHLALQSINFEVVHRLGVEMLVVNFLSHQVCKSQQQGRQVPTAGGVW